MGRLTIILSILVVIYSKSEVNGARILCVGHQITSHLRVLHDLTEDLIKDGHEVYTIISDAWDAPSDLEKRGFKTLQFHSKHDVFSSKNHQEKLRSAIFSGGQDLQATSQVVNNECKDMDNDTALDKKLFDLKFDLAVIDVFPLTFCNSHVPLKLNIPFVVCSMNHQMEIMRLPLLPSFVPGGMLPFSDDMSFIQRLINTGSVIMTNIPLFSPFPAIRDMSLLQKYNKDPSVHSWSDLVQRSSLFFIDRGPILEYPVPITPNVISLECLTCKPGKPLPPETEKIANASSGIIVVTFGSNIADLTPEIIQKFIKALSNRTEASFIRYIGEIPGEIPPNVMVMDWLPQNDLLAHPKTKLFITHGGNSGQYEACYHGVPMLAFPLFAEQHRNAHRITVHGYGMQSNIHKFTTEEMSQKIDKLIDDPSFRENTVKASRILKSRSMSAPQLAKHWILHILEFGSDHLRSHALEMPWYSFYMVDVFIVYLVTLFIIAKLMMALIRFVNRFVNKKVCAKKTKIKGE